MQPAWSRALRGSALLANPRKLLRERQALTEALRQSTELLAYQASHDGLTGLPNRKRMLDWLDAALPEASLLFIDLDRFKEVNDSWGHLAGDEALLLAGARLQKCCPSPALVARIGGDEFVVMLPSDDPQLAQTAGRAVARALGEPAQLPSGPLIQLAPSVGVAVARASSTADSLVHEADSALHHAKHSGRGHVIVFDQLLRDDQSLRGRLESDLRTALDSKRVTAHFQPFVRLADGETVGAEALLRLEDAQRGPHLPALLVEVAESTGIILDVGARVMIESCAVAARWGDPAAFVSVNVTAREVMHPDFTRGLMATLKATGLAPGRLWLELTERSLVDAGDETLRVLRELASRGIRIGIDDFGTGYSSITYLRTLPVSFIKIDRSFVNGLGVDDGDTAFVRALLDISVSLGITTIGEGVETVDQAQHLTKLGCEIGQGYFWARPGPAASLGIDLL